MPSNEPSHLRAVIALALMSGAAALGALAGTADAADTSAKKIDGSPMSVYVGPRGQCQSSYIVNGRVAGNFFPGGDPYVFSPVADCGFLLAFPTAGSGQPTALKGRTFGFKLNAETGAFNLYTPVSQSDVAGDGTEASPYSQTTAFEVVDSSSVKDALVTETTTYVNGAPYFTSSYNVKNVSAGPLYFRAIYAADLFVSGSDQGSGVFLAGPPRFVGGQNTASGVLGGLQEVPSPALPWSSFEELAYPTIWQRLSETIEQETAFTGGLDANDVDNAVGVEWDQMRSKGLASGDEQSFSIVNRTQIPSALRVQPVTQTHSVGQTATVTVTAADNVGTPYAGRPLVYSTGGANPKSGSVTTSASGLATIRYSGTAAGIDTVQLFLDLAGTGTQTPQDPASAAQITWLPVSPTLTPDSRYTLRSVKANSDGTITIVLVPSQAGTALVEVTVPTATISRDAALAATGEPKTKKCKKSQIRIKGRCRQRTTVSGKLKATGRARVPLKLTVRPSRKVKAALRHGRKVRLTAKLTYRAALGGRPTVRSLEVTVPEKKRRKHQSASH